MAGNRVSKYSIELEIKGADDTRRSIDDIEKTLLNISKSAKDGIGDGLNRATQEAEDLAKKIKEIAKNGEQSTGEIEAYGKAANKAISDLEKQSTKLTYSLSEQGKAQRERIVELQKELKTLGQTKEEKQRAKDIEKEIKTLQKDVVEGSDQELQDALKKNRSIRATLKLSQQEAKLTQAQAKQNKSMMAYVKGDLNTLKEKLKLQFEFIKALKTTEGRYKAIKTAAAKIGQGSAKIAKAGLMGAGGFAAGALALGGAAVSGAASMVDREREADRIKTSMSKDEKQALLGDLYIRTGADYTSIVDAINRVTTVLGTGLKADELSQAAAAEIRFPGAAAMFRQQNATKATANDFSIYQNRLKAIQGATGATVDQVQSSTEKIANMRQSSFSNASMTELQALYLGLQNSGAYDTQEELDRAFNSFVRSQKNSKESVFEHASRFDWQSKAYGATNKQQVSTAMQNLDFGSLEKAAKTTDSNIVQSEAEKTAQKMREFEEKKTQMMMKIVDVISPIFDSINTQQLTEFFNSIMKFATTIAPAIGELTNLMLKIFNELQPYLTKFVYFVSTGLSKLADSINYLYEWLKNSGVINNKQADRFKDMGISGIARSNGGLVSMPSIAGEAGSEMVVPLDFSRSSRGRELTQNLTQYFNMSGNETTALSLAQAVKTRDFSRAMASNAFINGRLGR